MDEVIEDPGEAKTGLERYGGVFFNFNKSSFYFLFIFFAFCTQLLTLEGNSILDMFVGMLFLLNNSQVLNILAKIYPANC